MYYGIKKQGSKRKDRFLNTNDRKLAERKLKTWAETLDKLDSEAEETTLEQLLEKFQKIRQGTSESTKSTEKGIVKKLKSTWKWGLDMRVSQIRPSMLDEWLAQSQMEHARNHPNEEKTSWDRRDRGQKRRPFPANECQD